MRRMKMRKKGGVHSAELEESFKKERENKVSKMRRKVSGTVKGRGRNASEQK